MTTNRPLINKANSLHSTGPRTAEGKQRASMNALKHGLTGQRLILQPDEHAAYRELTESLHAELAPKTTMELQLVQKIIDTHMRLNRVAALDNNLLNFGLIEKCRDVKEGGAEDDDTEIARAQAHSWLAQQMSFEKLGRYEGRLSRQLIAYSKELDRLQTLRAQKEESRRDRRLLHGSRRAGKAARRAAAQSAQPTEITTGRPPMTAQTGHGSFPQNSRTQPDSRSFAPFGSESELAQRSAPPTPKKDAPEQAA